MEEFFSVAAAVLLTALIALLLSGRSKEIALLLSIAVCCMVIGTAAAYLKPVITFLRELEQMGQLDHQFLAILLKCVAIGFLTELSVLVCQDAGNAALGKTLQILSSAVILWLSLPLLSGLVSLIHRILGAL